MKNNKQGFAVPLIIAIIALIAIGGGVYIYTKNKSSSTTLSTNTQATSTIQTVSWKTYTDSQQRFSIKYSPDWHSVINARQDYVVFCPTSDSECNANAIYVYVYTKGGSKDILNDFRKQGSGYKEKNIIINGKSAIEREESYCNGTPRLTNGVFIEGSTNDFQIQGPYYECGPAKEGVQVNYDESEKVFNQMLTTFKFTSTPSQTTSTEKNTVGWSRYDSGRGFEFKYPTYFSLDNSSTADNIVLNYNQGGTNYFSVNIKNSTQTLEQDVQATVATEKAESAQTAAPVTVSSKVYTIGNTKGYLITSQAGDVPNNTSAMFKMKDGNNIVTFRYSYQGYIFMKNPSDVTGGAPVTAEFQSDLQAKLKAYNDIQTIISTFKFFH